MLFRIGTTGVLGALAGAAMLLATAGPSSAFTLSSPSLEPSAGPNIEQVWWRHGGGWHHGWHGGGWHGGWRGGGWRRGWGWRGGGPGYGLYGGPRYGFYGGPVAHCWFGPWGHRHCVW